MIRRILKECEFLFLVLFWGVMVLMILGMVGKRSL